jgi:drug/metabolite transporter (DMT)-like permease
MMHPPPYRTVFIFVVSLSRCRYLLSNLLFLPSITSSSPLLHLTTTTTTTTQRVIVIIGVAIVLGESLDPIKLLGCGIGIGGVFLYSIIDTLFPPAAKK